MEAVEAIESWSRSWVRKARDAPVEPRMDADLPVLSSPEREQVRCQVHFYLFGGTLSCSFAVDLLHVQRIRSAQPGLSRRLDVQRPPRDLKS